MKLYFVSFVQFSCVCLDAKQVCFSKPLTPWLVIRDFCMKLSHYSIYRT